MDSLLTGLGHMDLECKCQQIAEAEAPLVENYTEATHYSSRLVHLTREGLTVQWMTDNSFMSNVQMFILEILGEKERKSCTIV